MAGLAGTRPGYDQRGRRCPARRAGAAAQFGPAVAGDITEVDEFLTAIQPDAASCSYLKTQMCIQVMDHAIKEVGVYLGKPNTGKTTLLLLTGSTPTSARHLNVGETSQRQRDVSI